MYMFVGMHCMHPYPNEYSLLNHYGTLHPLTTPEGPEYQEEALHNYRMAVRINPQDTETVQVEQMFVFCFLRVLH